MAYDDVFTHKERVPSFKDNSGMETSKNASPNHARYSVFTLKPLVKVIYIYSELRPPDEPAATMTHAERSTSGTGLLQASCVIINSAAT